MKDHKDSGFHSRRLIVAPRRHRVRVSPLRRTVTLPLNLIDVGFALLYAVLVARLVLLLMDGSMSRILTRMLLPFSDPFIVPFTAVLPPILPEPLHLLVPVLAAIGTSVLLHWLLRWGMRRLGRLPHSHTTDSAVTLLQRFAREGERIRVRMVDAIREA